VKFLRVVPWLALLVASAARVASAQAPTAASGWDDPRVTDLITRAIARRASSDTLLKDYRARAHGYLSFLAQLGDTLTEPPKLVKSSELMVDVLWKAPALSKQIVVGLRDTALVPGDIGYYTDRYGIVQSNFADKIRMGDAQDVRDVPHPVSKGAPMLYSYRVRDSLTLQLPGRRVDVWEIDVRPRDEIGPRVVGSLFIERTTGDIVRMSLTFTRAALLDKRIEVLAVTLENALVEEQFWLPRRQELEVRRAGTWFDFPARGIIRGRWEVGEYVVNRGIETSAVVGPPIVFADYDKVMHFPFEGRLLDGLPENVRPVSPEDVERVQQVATEVLSRGAIAKAEGLALSAGGISDLLRVNRVEGLAVGLGARFRPLASVSVAVRGRYGLSDTDAKGGVTLSVIPKRGVQLDLFGSRDYRDVLDEPETSLARNSLASQEFGADYTQPYRVQQAGVALQLGVPGAAQWRLEVGAEGHEALTVHASPATGQYAGTIAAPSLSGTRVSLSVTRRVSEPVLGGTLDFGARLAGGQYALATTNADVTTLRGFAQFSWLRPMNGWQLATHATAAASAGSGALLPQQLVYLGGPVSGPGYDFSRFASRAGATLRLEARLPVPFVPVPLGRFGRVPGTAVVAPFLHVIGVSRSVIPGVADGLYPSVGLGGLLFFDLLRVDVARGLRDGRWTFNLDVAKSFWGVL
jgi:hypothetical protein